jgi:hypothetical protein
VAAIVFAACSSDAKSAATATTDVAAETTVPSATAAPSGDLDALLITSLPAGFTQMDDIEVDTGPSDFAKAVSDDGGTDAEEVLTSAGFVNGYQRAWQGDDGNARIVVFLYQFSKDDGAASYADRSIEGFDADPSIEPTPFDIAEIPGARGRSMTNLEADGDTAVAVVFTKGGYLVQILVLGGSTDEVNQTLAQQLAKDQFDRL